ncbi:MAG: YidC/Oxa1 family membrane protein insertase [Blastocatellales bacterium]
MPKKIAQTTIRLSLLWLLICLGCNLVFAQTGQKAETAKTPSAAQDKYVWLTGPEASRETVTSSLNAIAALSQSDAANEAALLRTAKASATAEGQRAAGLLLGAALEKTGDLSGARAAYQEAVSQAKDSPYAASAAYRLRVLEDPHRSPDEQEKFYEKLYEETIAQKGAQASVQATKTGWFLVSNQWSWTDSWRATAQALIDLRSTELSSRLFSWLRSKSTFPTPYAYFFVLLALSVGVKILALPLYVRAAKLQIQFRQLAPEIAYINSIYDYDPQTKQQQLAKLYQERGVNVLWGCAVGLIDLIFVVWSLVALSDFAPQMALDGAMFWWIPNVLQRDLGILIVAVGLVLLQSLINSAYQPTSIGQIACGSLVFGAIFVGVAWYFQWPAAAIIFWVLLSLIGLLLNLILVGILKLVD